jgi:MinD superfamily P-loop ATPase
VNEITILSGKGGTGKTCLSVAFATLGERMVMADCDVDAANLHLILQPENTLTEKFITGQKAVVDYDTCTNCGLCINYCRFGAIAWEKGKITISETACDGCGLCFRICPSKSLQMVLSDRSHWYAGTYRNGFLIHARLAPGEENSGKLVNVVREHARKTAAQNGLETIIIDGPPGTGCPVISSVTGAGKAVIVTEPSLSAFHDLKRILELITNFKVQPYVVINKYDLNEAIAGQVTDWLDEMKVPLAGIIPFDKQIVEAMLHCQSITEWSPTSETSKTIRSIWESIKK